MDEPKNDAPCTHGDAAHQIENISSNNRNAREGFSNHCDALIYDIGNDLCGLDKKIQDTAIELATYVESISTFKHKIIIPESTASILKNWLQTFNEEKLPATNGHCSLEVENSHKKLRRLEEENDSLLLQVSILSDQVQVQGEKMRELEFLKDELLIKLADFEEAMEKDNEIKAMLAKKDVEIKDLQSHLKMFFNKEKQGNHLLSSNKIENNSCMKAQLREKASEVSSVKMKIEKLETVLTEKENKIKDLKRQLQTISSSKLSMELTKSDISVPTSDVCGSNNEAGKNKWENEEISAQHGKENVENKSSKLIHTKECHFKKPDSTITGKMKKSDTVNKDSQPFKRESQTRSSFGRTSFARSSFGRSSFGKGLFKLKQKHNCNETSSPSADNSSNIETPTKNVEDTQEKAKKKNIVGKVIGKLRRSNTHGFDTEINDRQFSYLKRFPSNDPFSTWSCDLIVSWMEDEGLGQYTEACLNHVKTGDDLQNMTSSDLEKVLGMKKLLHRKKLQLALQAVNEGQEDFLSALDNTWILEWLDDIGLPQYKDSFRENLVDGRMLNYLTINDVLQLKIYNTFHQHSLKSAIQCLRIYNFHPNYLKKSPIDESWQHGADVILWTNYRVTEWLRQADLSEYVGNLLNSGVHGAFMILEPRFTAETMATVLSIPSGKKLLRRHLATHFESLVGSACLKVKETALANGFTALIPGEKQKPRKLSISGIKKRTKSDIECEEYICPMDSEVPQLLQSLLPTRTRKNDNSSQQGVEISEKDQQSNNKDEDQLTKTLGNFSKELHSLTNMLGHEPSR